MNVTLMLKSVAKLFHIILYTYSVKTNLNLCESFYFDYHLLELIKKGFIPYFFFEIQPGKYTLNITHYKGPTQIHCTVTV